MRTSDATTAALCPGCHFEIDHGTRMTRDERRSEMDAAIVKTMARLIETGKLRLR